MEMMISGLHQDESLSDEDMVMMRKMRSIGWHLKQASMKPRRTGREGRPEPNNLYRMMTLQRRLN